MTYINSVTATTSPQSLTALLASMPGGVSFKAREVTLQMSPNATGTLYVGGPTSVSSTQSVELDVGQSWTIRAGDGRNTLDLGSVWLVASAGTIRVNAAVEVG